MSTSGVKHALQNLSIKGFKSIHSLESFVLRDLNILVGENGSGKSNFIEFFRMLRAMMKKEGLKEFVQSNSDTFLYGGAKTTKAIEVKLRFGQNGYDFELAPTQDGKFMINNEQRHYLPDNHEHHITRNLGSGNFNPELLNDMSRSGFRTKQNASWYAYQAISSWQIYHFHDTGTLSGMRRYHDKGHKDELLSDASNIAPFLLHLRSAHPSSYADILTSIRFVIPFFGNFDLKPNADENLRLDWRQTGLNDFTMRPTSLSDGSIRFICLATALLQPDPPATIVIDEPELGLHPQAIAVLAELIQAAAKRTQVILATQSAELMNHFAIEDIIVVSRSNGRSEFNRLKEEDYNQWLENYSVGELWSKNVFATKSINE